MSNVLSRAGRGRSITRPFAENKAGGGPSLGETALILASHGSGDGGELNERVRRIAEAIRERALFADVAVGFHKGTPSFKAALDRVAARNAIVVPVLTSDGYYARVVVPRELRASRRFTDIPVTITPVVGTHSWIVDAVEERVRSLGVYACNRSPARGRLSIIVVGHGTRRVPESAAATRVLVRALRSRLPDCTVDAAFLDDDPGICEIVPTITADRLLVIPFFIGEGDHVTRDIHNRLRSSLGHRAREGQNVTVAVDMPVGAYSVIPDVVLDLALAAATEART